MGVGYHLSLLTNHKSLTAPGPIKKYTLVIKYTGCTDSMRGNSTGAVVGTPVNQRLGLGCTLNNNDLWGSPGENLASSMPHVRLLKAFPAVIRTGTPLHILLSIFSIIAAYVGHVDYFGTVLSLVYPSNWPRTVSVILIFELHCNMLTLLAATACVEPSPGSIVANIKSCSM